MSVLTTTNLFEQELRKILKEQIEGAKDRLVSSPFETIGGFEKVRGEIFAYNIIVDMIDEAKSNVEKRLK